MLKEFYQNIIIPPAIKKEVIDQGKNRPGSMEVKKSLDEGWIKITEIKNKYGMKNIL